MFSKLRNIGPYKLLPLLVMLYITVGMPLVHPLISKHSEQDRTVSAGGDLSFQNSVDEGQEHHCPICDFDAANQLHATACNTVLDWNQPIDDFVFIKLSFSLKATPQHVDARAPPSPSAIS